MEQNSILNIIIYSVLVISMGSPASAASRHCQGNELKGRYMCNCHEGNIIDSITSTFDRNTDDRVWNISCSVTSLYVAKSRTCEDLTTKWTEYKTNFNLTFKSHAYACLFKHGVLTGWESEYDSRMKDRRYRFTYTIPHMWGVVIEHCRDRKISSFETQGHFAVSEGQVVHGIKSVFNSKYNDREWHFNVCKITRECDIIKDITFSNIDTPDEILSYTEITRESQVTDATGHTGNIETELTLSSETSKSLTETQRFESTSQSSVSNTASVSVSATIEVPFVVMQVEGGYEFRSERMTSKTWSRETATEYTETNGKEIEWQYTCNAGTKCEAIVSIYQAVVKVPYTMKVGSSNSMEMCIEKGVYERVQTFTKFHVTSTVSTTTTSSTLKTTTTKTTIKQTTAHRTPSSTTLTTSTTPTSTAMTMKTTTATALTSSSVPQTHQAPLPLKAERLSKSPSSNSTPMNEKPFDSNPMSPTPVSFNNFTYGEEKNRYNSLFGMENSTDITQTNLDLDVPKDSMGASGDDLKDDKTDADSKRPLMENQAVSPLVDNKNTTSKAQNGEENKKKLLIDEENLTTKGGINLGTLLSGNSGSVLKEILKPGPENHKVDCKEDEILPSLCQKIYGCVNGVPAAAKITAYMFAMAMSIALAMKLTTVLMT